jgi:dihydrofolate reductase
MRSPRPGRLTGMGIVTCDLSISLDGYAAGPNQTLERPFGDGVEDGDQLHAWMFEHAADHPDELAAITAAGAFLMGRNMFGPGRGDWDLDWVGWWGPDPPYHAPVFVLTHVPRQPVEMDGGTTFHFVTEGPVEALRRARDAAGDADVAVAGGVTTVNQYLASGSIDELRLHVVPAVLDLGSTRLFDGVGTITWSSTSVRSTPEVTHLVLRR